MRCLTFILLTFVLMVPVRESEAGPGSLIAKGVRIVSQQFRKAAGRTTTRAGGKTARQSVKAAGRSTTGAGTRLSGKAMTRSVGAASKVSTDAAATVLKHLGSSGVAAMSRLKPDAAARFVRLAPDLARSPYRGQWLTTIGRYGGDCVDFLWQHRNGLAVGTVAAAALMQPDDFLASIERVAEAGVNATGEFVAKPIIEQAARHVAAPAVRETARTVVSRTSWSDVVINVTIIAAFVFGWWHFRRR